MSWECDRPAFVSHGHTKQMSPQGVKDACSKLKIRKGEKCVKLTQSYKG